MVQTSFVQKSRCSKRNLVDSSGKVSKTGENIENSMRQTIFETQIHGFTENSEIQF